MNRGVTWVKNSEIRLGADRRYEVGLKDEFPFKVTAYDFTGPYKLTPSFHDFLEIVHCCEGRGVFHMEDRGMAGRQRMGQHRGAPRPERVAATWVNPATEETKDAGVHEVFDRSAGWAAPRRRCSASTPRPEPARPLRSDGCAVTKGGRFQAPCAAG